MKLRGNRRGFSLFEALAAVGLLGAGSYAMMYGISQLQTDLNSVKEISQREYEIANVIENLRANIGLFQANYSHSGTMIHNASLAESFLNPDTLPLEWSDQGIFPKGGCRDCVGRMGYVIQPMENMKGLFLVTVRVVNEKYFKGYKDYKFVVAGK